jgi:hypothetical protein
LQHRYSAAPMTGEITVPAPLAVDPAAPPERFVVVLDEALPSGHAANVAAVLAITLGATVEGLMGEALVDGDGREHPGLIPFGLPILAASRAAIAELRTRAAAAEVGVIAFPAHGQQTNDWDAVRRHVAEVPPDELEWLGLVVHGSRRAVNRLTGNLRLLR